MTREQAIECVYAALGELRFYLAGYEREAIATASLDAYHAHLTASGMAIVPVEPTEAMERAGEAGIDVCDAFRRMIAAAQGEA